MECGYQKWPIATAALLLFLSCGMLTAATADDLDVIAGRAASAQLPPQSTIVAFDAAVSLNLSYVLPNYTFADINYTYCVNANWPAMIHPERVQSFSAAFASPLSRHYRNATLLATIHGLLDFWLEWNIAHHSTNWWMEDVGTPSFLARAGLILQYVGSLTPTEEAGIVASTRRADSYKGCEPTNCAWLAGNVFLGALLERNATTVARTLHDVFSTLNTTNPFAPNDPSGIKEDGSFMMHGSLLYSGGYGMCYARVLFDLLAWTRATSFALPDNDPRWSLFSHFLLDGSLRMVHYGSSHGVYGPSSWDISALGRNYARPYGRDPASAAGQAVTWDPMSVLGVGGPRAAEFTNFGALLNGTSATAGVDPSFLAFSRHFYEADYTIHSVPLAAQGGPQLAHWTSSAFAASSRTRRSEITNAEGIASWHIAENSIWTMLNGTEFLDAFPAMSMAQVPGTTVLSYHKYTDGDVGGEGVTAFVGGASLGSAFSVTANDFIAPNNAGLSYRKFTFFSPNAVVALTANITAVSASAAVWTTIEQRRASGGSCVSPGSPAPSPVPVGGVFTSAAGTAAPLPLNFNGTLPSSTWWVWEGRIAYVLLDRVPGRDVSTATLHVSSLITNGSWSVLGVWPDFVACNIFSLWLEHAVPVSGADAAYAVVPGVALDEWAGGLADAFAANLTVVENSGALQAVVHAADDVLAAVTYSAPASVQSAGWNASFSSPAAYVLARGDALITLAAAQPAQMRWSANVTVGGHTPSPGALNCTPAEGGVTFNVDSPPGGSTVLITC
jgi:hypothetical protein